MRFYDPQVGQVKIWNDLVEDIKLGTIELYRVDKLQINTEIINGIVSKAGTTKALTNPIDVTAKKARIKYIILKNQNPNIPVDVLKKLMNDLFPDNFDEIWKYIQSKERGGMLGAEVRGKISNPLPESVKQRRKEIKELAMSLTKSDISNKAINKPIKITRTAIKEWLNQPFKYYEEKNELLLNFEQLFIKSNYKGWGYNYRNNNLKVHIFETEVKGEKAWIIIKENESGELYLHSISDSPSILNGIINKSQ